MEKEIANSPRETSTVEKEQGGRCAWLATTDGGARWRRGCGRSDDAATAWVRDREVVQGAAQLIWGREA